MIDRVRKSYGGLVAVDGLSLEVRRGEILGLLGPNGAGKTTTVGLATGLLEPDEGRVDIEGAGPPTSPEARRRLGVAPQSLALYESLTGRENLEFFASIQGLEGEALRERVRAALLFVGLAERAGERVSGYSGGMKRRLNLAAAVVHDPEIVLLDEPTVGVDPQSRGLIFDNVLALARPGSHDRLRHALHGGGGAAVRPGRDRGPRPAPRPRHRRLPGRRSRGRGRARRGDPVGGEAPR